MKALQRTLIIISGVLMLLSLYPIGRSFNNVLYLHASGPYGGEFILVISLSMAISTLLILTWEATDKLYDIARRRSRHLIPLIGLVLAFCVWCIISEMNSHESYFEDLDPSLGFEFYFDLLDVLFVLLIVQFISLMIRDKFGRRAMLMVASVSVLMLSLFLSLGPVGLATGLAWSSLAVTLFVESMVSGGETTAGIPQPRRIAKGAIPSLIVTVLTPVCIYLLVSNYAWGA